MTKQEQFLWVVQTMILANAINLASQPELAEANRHSISATGAFISADDALYASTRIPGDLSASEAAHIFCAFSLQKEGETVPCPDWCARG